MGQKACTQCGDVLDLEQFPPCRKNLDGRYSYCFPCKRSKWLAWREKNREYNAERCRKYTAEWKRRFPERVQERKRRRRELEALAPGGPFDPAREDYKARVALWGGACSYCSGPYEVLDHAVPLCRGGSNHAENIRPACFSCNRRKYTKTAEEFLAAKNKTPA